MTAYTELNVKALELAITAIENSATLEEAKQRIQKAITNLKEDEK